MRFALVDGKHTEAAPRLRGKCDFCASDMVPKCGRYVRWHWAHKRRIGCDPWYEAETEWHRMWKDCFPSKCQEVIHVDPRTGERHIADVKASSGRVVEVQHSPISESEVLSREGFYGDMIWIVDARHLSGHFMLGTSHDLATCNPMAYHFQWLSRSMLLARWSVSGKPVYFDSDFRSATSDVDVPLSKRVLWRLFEFDPDDNFGFIAPVPADWLVRAVLDGGPLPLLSCEERDAWRYRRELVEVDR